MTQDTALALRAYREALGLNQPEAARMVGVQQSGWSKWENGLREPRDMLSTMMILHTLMDYRDELFDDMCDYIESLEPEEEAVLRTYATDEAFWADYPNAGVQQLPAALHRTAAALCAFVMLDEHGIVVSIENAG
ncbi:MAG: helix-turn-helix transcriptional regulator [Actinomycetaceae bacterium]|nr:helix-turn-helix transcriptional regulator [Actinomycetaceae bacterium]